MSKSSSALGQDQGQHYNRVKVGTRIKVKVKVSTRFKVKVKVSTAVLCKISTLVFIRSKTFNWLRLRLRLGLGLRLELESIEAQLKNCK